MDFKKCIFFASIILLIGCSGKDGINGINGTDGRDGISLRKEMIPDDSVFYPYPEDGYGYFKTSFQLWNILSVKVIDKDDNTVFCPLFIVNNEGKIGLKISDSLFVFGHDYNILVTGIDDGY